MAIKVGKSYESVEALLKGEYPDHPEYVESFQKAYKDQCIAQTLFLMRTYHGITQAEMAKRLGVTQSAVAKMEDRGDQVRVNDAIRFASALGYDARFEFIEKSATLASVINTLLRAVADHMAELEKVAADDPEIKAGVLRHFTGEVQKMLIDVLPKFAEFKAEPDSGNKSVVAGVSSVVHADSISTTMMA